MSELINKARKHCGDSICDVAVALENAKGFVDDKNDKELEIWKETLEVIKEEAIEALAKLDDYIEENTPSEIDEQEDALRKAEGRI